MLGSGLWWVSRADRKEAGKRATGLILLIYTSGAKCQCTPPFFFFFSLLLREPSYLWSHTQPHIGTATHSLWEAKTVAVARCSSPEKTSSDLELGGQKKGRRESWLSGPQHRALYQTHGLRSASRKSLCGNRRRAARLCVRPRVLGSIRLCLFKLVSAGPSHFL